MEVKSFFKVYSHKHADSETLTGCGLNATKSCYFLMSTQAHVRAHSLSTKS